MFNEKLIELRKQNSHTQESIAKQLHVSCSLIAKWEQGRAYPTLDDLNNILKLYNLEFDDLMTKEELKNIYGIVSKKEKNKKKIILSLTLILSVLLVSISILPFCSITNVPQATKISAKYSMKCGGVAFLVGIAGAVAIYYLGEWIDDGWEWLKKQIFE